MYKFKCVFRNSIYKSELLIKTVIISNQTQSKFNPFNKIGNQIVPSRRDLQQ